MQHFIPLMISECRKFGMFLLISDLSSFNVKNEKFVEPPKNVSSVVRGMLPQKNHKNYVSKIS